MIARGRAFVCEVACDVSVRRGRKHYKYCLRSVDCLLEGGRDRVDHRQAMSDRPRSLNPTLNADRLERGFTAVVEADGVTAIYKIRGRGKAAAAGPEDCYLRHRA